MSFEPQKFFIGLMDFFSILLPGAVLTYVIKDRAGPAFIDSYPVTGAEGVAVFLVASYLLGHFVFLLGALLDDRIYDRLRSKTLNKQIRMLAKHHRLLPAWQRRLIRLLFKDESDTAVDRVGRIKRAQLAKAGAGGAVNNFQWSKAFLAIESPDSFVVVQRAEADSKFFRCLVVVLIVLCIYWSSQEHWFLAAGMLALLPFTLWRYMELRYKSTNQAYWSVIAFFGSKGTCQFESSVSAVPAHAGGVVYRTRDTAPEYLLVTATNDPTIWVLPKGHREDGESERETAVREIREEAGIWADPVDDLGCVTLDVDGSSRPVRFYLMKYLADAPLREAERESRWLPLDKAVQLASFNETRELLHKADQQRRRGASQ